MKKLLLAAICFFAIASRGLNANAAIGSAPGVCTYDSQSALYNINPEHDVRLETGNACTDGSSFVELTGATLTGSLYLNDQSVRIYTASVTLPAPVCGNTDYDGHLEEQNFSNLYSQLQSKMAADCAALQAGGVCFCLGPNEI